ncbi:MAG: shikimate kinase AroK [Pseudomonadales bacterium]
MNSSQRVYLVGPMGAGKSTIGRLLSKELSLPFKDTDHEIEERTGADIPWIFDMEGEEGFRDRETAVIDELTQLSEVVLATGGGAILRKENRQFLASRGTVVYLETSVDQQYQRTLRDKNRPLIQQDDPRAVLEALLAVRDPLYRAAADLVVSTHLGNPQAVVRKIRQFINSPYDD